MIYDVCGRIAGPVEAMDKLVDEIKMFFGNKSEAYTESKGKTLFLKNVTEHQEIEVYIAKNDAGLIYESELLKRDFEFSYVIGFDVMKESPSIDLCYQKAIGCMRHLAEKFQYETLTTFDFERDIFYMSGDGFIEWNEQIREHYSL